ncbi:MAG: translation elongation factor EF-1 subunit alpha [Candidatus Diapherotrites archaeon]|nr:translation elongation factor EF-1 subunit alpha [Candidatus Diapherotrites archaeon]
MAAEKPHMNLVFIGHVDHGKSTAVGRILVDSGNIPEQVRRKLKDEADKLGKGTFDLAFVMDTLKEERERGVTIDVNYREFNTDKYYFTIIDAPGHRDFVKNMITGTSQADAAVLVVAANDGVMAQTKEHAWLSKVLGINNLIVAINKMDVVKFEESKFNEVKDDVVKLVSGIGFKPDNVKYVPISAYGGDNVIKKSDNMSWYKGPTLEESLDKLPLPERPVDLPLRLSIQGVYSITGAGTVGVGRVETGILRPNEKVVILPGRTGEGLIGEVKSIEQHHQELKQAAPGDNIGFNLRGISKKDIGRGDVLGHVDNPPTVVTEFTAQIIVMSHPTAVTVGYTPVFHLHTAQVACTITEITKKMDPKTGAVTEENPSFIKNGDAAVVKIKPTRPVVIEKFSEFPPLGRFAIRDMGQTVAAGIVLDVVSSSKKSSSKKSSNKK